MNEAQRLRICVASSGLGHVLRGVESWAQELGIALAARGESVVLCKGTSPANSSFERVIPCWTRDSQTTQRLLQYIPKPLGWRMGLGGGYGVEQCSFAWNLIWFLKREQIDILHLQDPQVAILVQRAAQAGLLRTRTILNHGTEEPLEFLKKIEFLQHGAPWHQQTAESAGVWKESWTMIPNFVNTRKYFPGKSPQLRNQLGIPPTAIVALVSAAIKRKHKRIDFVISEFARVRQQLPDRPLWLVVAGSRADDTDELMREAHQQLGNHVRFAVDLPSGQMPELYRMADLLLHASLKEMMPMTLLEATASGVPCVCHHHPVMEWIVGPGGMTIDMEIPGVLAQTVIELTLNGQRRAEFGAAARAQCIAHFERDIVVERVVKHYDSVHRFRREHAKAA